MRVNPNVGRFVSPKAYDKQLEKLHKTEGALKKAKTAVKEQKDIMMRSRYTPEGYKKAVAKLKTLEANVRKLDAEVKHIKDLLTRA